MAVGDSSGLEAIRARERKRREERRRARERGELPPLTAEHRRWAQADTRPGDRLGTEMCPRVLEQDPKKQPAVLPPRLKAALDRAAQECGDPSLFATVLASGCTDRGLTDALAGAALSAVQALHPLRGVATLVTLTEAGLPVLSEPGLARAEALITDRLPLPDVDPRVAEQADQESGNDVSWNLHLEYRAAARRVVLSSASWRSLVERLPLAVLDDLIDSGLLTARTNRGGRDFGGERGCYVTARLTPAALNDEDAEALGWHDEIRRRLLASGAPVTPVAGRHDQWSILAALRDGDLSVLNASAAVDRDLVPDAVGHMLAQMRSVRAGGTVPRDLGNDRGLWPLLESLLPPDRLVSGGTPFHGWAGARRMHRLLRQAHVSMARGRQDSAALFKSTAEQATAVKSYDTGGAVSRANWEARVVLAYVHFLSAGQGDQYRLDLGIGMLGEILRRRGVSRGGAPQAVRERLSRNSGLLKSLKVGKRCADVLNPYLLLDVDHGSSEWRSAWRHLRKELPEHQLPVINQAKDRIQRVESARRSGTDGERQAFKVCCRWRGGRMRQWSPRNR